jgi:hypothetical protein
LMWERTCRQWTLRIGRRAYWLEIYGRQFLSGPKLT